MYPRNVGILDRFVRLVVGAVLVPVGLLPLDGLNGDPFGILAIAIGGFALASALTGRCPGYVPFGIDTRRRRGTYRCCGPCRAGSSGS